MVIRSKVLSANPLCVHCEAKGRTRKAEHVDHIVPLHQGGTDSLPNLQGLCIPCHEAKTAQDAGRQLKSYGGDGWPVGVS